MGGKSHRSRIARFAAVLCVVVMLELVVSGVARADTKEEIVPSFTRGDNVHFSATPPAAASAHGWWTYARPTELKADVTVQLQIRRGEVWADVGLAGVERVRPGGGSANRSNARVPCVTFEGSEWRSVVDVDIVGVIDSPEKLFTPVQRLSCGA